MNKVFLLGNVGNDPEIKITQWNTKMATFSLATTESWKDKQSGERKTSTTWHRVVVLNPNIANIVESYVKKGSKLLVEGSISNRTYKDKDGVEKNTTEIVISLFKGEITMVSGVANEDSSGGYKKEANNFVSGNDDLDDEIPF